MLAAFVAAIAFLVSYVVYHYHAGSTRFPGQGIVRPIYYFILTTHVILAASILPLAIVTIRRAYREDFVRHRRIARWTWPLWVYVSITGLVVYFLLYHVYTERI
jgi:putative membrane protein